ncbi:MAG: protein kinase [Halioglobus sp.]
MGTERFENKTYIGSGGMATVYRAWDSVIGRDVALKEIAEELRADEEVREMFIREARKMAQVLHRNVIQIYDVLLDDESATLVEEYMDGGSLAKRVGASSMSTDETLKMLQDVTYGLQAIHEAGLVHRDMKPDNILSKNGEWKVGDFGVAMSGDEEVLPFLGSKYAAPEVLNAPETISERSDIYSMGIMAAELVLGSQRFEEVAREALTSSNPAAGGGTKETSATFWQRWVSSDAELPLLSSINPVISQEFSEFIQKLTASDPNDRHQDAAEVIDSIRGLRESESMRMGAPTAPDPRVKRKAAKDNKEKKKQPLWFKITATVGILLLAAVGFLLYAKSKPKTYDINLVTLPEAATVSINGSEHAEPTPTLTELRLGDSLVVTKQGFEARELVLAKGMDGLEKNDEGDLVLTVALELGYSMDTSRKAFEFFQDYWKDAKPFNVSLPTAQYQNNVFTVAIDTPLYLAMQPAHSGAITLVHLSADNFATLVYPNPQDASLGVQANTKITIGDELDMAASEPLGYEWMVVILTEKPLIPPQIEGSGLVEDWARYYPFGVLNSPGEQLVRWITENAKNPLSVEIVPLHIVTADGN